MVAGISFGSQGAQNTGQGFERSGLPKLVSGALSEIFPDENDGGVICCIDNLELLQTYAEAKRRIEELRDDLLQIRGLRWVLCGALGITYAFATSARLDGYLHRPIALSEIAASHSSEILSSRVSVYSDRPEVYLPITTIGFSKLYTILRGNLRNVLSYVDNYCQHVSDTTEPAGEAEKNERFDSCLMEEATRARQAAENVLTKGTTKVFRKACEMGSFAPSNNVDFGLETASGLRNYIKALEEVDLIVSVRDETDRRRKSIQVTAKGWFVLYSLGSIDNDASLRVDDEISKSSSD